MNEERLAVDVAKDPFETFTLEPPVILVAPGDVDRREGALRDIANAGLCQPHAPKGSFKAAEAA